VCVEKWYARCLVNHADNESGVVYEEQWCESHVVGKQASLVSGVKTSHRSGVAGSSGEFLRAAWQ